MCILQELVISQRHNQCICSIRALHCICTTSTRTLKVAQPMHLLSTELHCSASVPLVQLHQACIRFYTACTASLLNSTDLAKHPHVPMYCNNQKKTLNSDLQECFALQCTLGELPKKIRSKLGFCPKGGGGGLTQSQLFKTTTIQNGDFVGILSQYVGCSQVPTKKTPKITKKCVIFVISFFHQPYFSLRIFHDFQKKHLKKCCFLTIGPTTPLISVFFSRFLYHSNRRHFKSKGFYREKRPFFQLLSVFDHASTTPF